MKTRTVSGIQRTLDEGEVYVWATSDTCNSFRHLQRTTVQVLQMPDAVWFPFASVVVLPNTTESWGIRSCARGRYL